MLTVDAPADEAVAARVPLACHNTLHRIAFVLQVSPLPGTSDQDKFYYDPFANIKTCDFAVAHAFFIHHGHTLVYQECPDGISFQELFPLASIGYISSLPKGLLVKGHELLAAQRCLLQATVHAPPPVTRPQLILNCYMAAGFGISWEAPPLQDGTPLASATSSDSTYHSGSGLLWSPSGPVGCSRAFSTAVPPCVPHRDSSSQCPDPNGFDDSSLLPYRGH
jgi:hypothetical protein